MTAPSLLDELEGVVGLAANASDDEPWQVDQEGDVVCNGEQVAWPISNKLDAPYIAALNNWFRAHHAEIADMAKRLEAVERDAARYRFLRDRMDSGDVAKVADVFPDGCEEISLKVDAAIDAAMAEAGNPATEQDQQLAATQEGEG